MSETTAPRPGPELFPPAEPHPQTPFSNRRLEQTHANVGLSSTTRQIALVLLRLPSTRREAAYQNARRLVASSEAVLTLLEQAARLHELDQMFQAAGTEQQPIGSAAAEQPSTWWEDQPVEVDLYPGGEGRWSAARLVSIDSEGRALVVHLDDGARQLVELAKLRPAPLPYLQVPDAEAQS